ncbi:hypothetical protein I5G22_29545 [Pseudomonas aeruginosa]|nr:hypothetical protein [Pseudomonas aeruginosa]
MARPSPPMPLLAAALRVAGAIPLGFIWILTSAKFEIGGASPGESTVGKVENIDQRAMEQFCTGVRATPAGTWLVGRREVGRDEQALPEGVIDLDLVAAAQPREEESEPHLFNFLNGMLLSGGDPETTYVSRLGADGVFHEVARLGETACLEVTPDGSSVFLLTGLRRPGKDNGQREQTVVLRSDDQGKSWRRLEEGFMAEANRLGWALAPRFHGKDEVWVWGDFEYGGADGGQEPGQPSGLFYSPDRGASVESIATSAPLLVDLAYARELAPNGVSWGDYNGKHGQIKAHVAQLDAERAAIWVSQTFRYGPPEGRYLTSSILVTTQAELRREGGRWQMGAIRRTDGVAVERLEQNMDGRVIAVLDHPDESRSLIAELDRDALEWKITGKLPSPFWPLPSSSGLREFYMGRNVLLANTMSHYEVPLWLYPDEEPASVSANAVYYSDDWGSSWRRLDIAGYLGVLGFDEAHDRVFWARGNWYDSRDLGVQAYDLN